MKDRKDLNLDGGADALIEAVAKVSKNTIVLMQIPGVVVMPWRGSVSAILAMFLGGQETGNAWAAVLFGDHAPTGRLPVMMPATEQDTIQPESEDHVPYSEGLATSYRNKHFKAAFPFGHGLTYTTFEFSSPSKFPCDYDQKQCINITVRNTGLRPGRAVAQLYLEFPPAAGQPGPVLKGFQKTPQLLPQESMVVTFGLTDRDLSYYSAHHANPGWVQARRATAHIGASSADLSQVVYLSERSKGSYGLVSITLLLAFVLLCLIAGIAVIAREAKRQTKKKRLKECREFDRSEGSSSDTDSLVE